MAAQVRDVNPSQCRPQVLFGLSIALKAFRLETKLTSTFTEAFIPTVNRMKCARVDFSMNKHSFQSRLLSGILTLLATSWFASCSLAMQPAAPPAGSTPGPTQQDLALQLHWTNRITWGANAISQAELKQQGLAKWLGRQLHPSPKALPSAAQAQIDAMTISRTPADQLVISLNTQRQAIEKLPDEEQKNTARQAYRQRLALLAHEAQQRFLFRALYSPNQLQEQLTWFWMNHFNISLRKNNLRALVGDYEDRAIRPNALGNFRDLLGAVVHHPAMLLYLDNTHNSVNRINENYARELLELHTLGVGGGYSQADVQDLARVLTGVNVNIQPLDVPPPKMRAALQGEYVRRGLFEFHPNRHDYGTKTLLGRPIESRGLAEVDEALDRLASAPATARFISRKLAVYFVADEPPRALTDRMAATFTRSNGNIAATLQAMFDSPEFAASLGRKFRDPIHYVIAGVRLAYDDRVALDLNPMMSWLSRMGQPLYGRETPDGYPLDEAAWSSAGQMNTRFEISQAIGANGAVLFRVNDKEPLEKPAFPPLAESTAVRTLQNSLGPNTREALSQAKTPQEWNTLLLASPELMRR